jgi:phospholipase/carboxylesterase
MPLCRTATLDPFAPDRGASLARNSHRAPPMSGLAGTDLRPRREAVSLLPMRLRLLLTVLLLASCSECARQAKPAQRAQPTEKIRWPASAATTLETELAVTAAEDGTTVASPGDPLPEGMPGVKVREQVAHGLYLIEVILGEADFDDPLPMVILLHGRGDGARVPGGPFGGVPTPMRLILPQGPQRLGKGYTWLPVSITEGRTALLAQSLRERAGQLARLVGSLRESRPTLGKPVVAGFSQGGMLALTLALHHGDLFSAAFPLASWLPPPLVPAGGPREGVALRIRSLHGAADPIIPLPPTRELFAKLGEQGWDVGLQEFEGVAHLMSPDMNAMFEAWLEDALHVLAPELEGGLGEPGVEPTDYAPYEALDEETLRAIELLEEERQELDDEGAGSEGEANIDPTAVPEDGALEDPDGGPDAPGLAPGEPEGAAPAAP